jgi:hypothetical protein
MTHAEYNKQHYHKRMTDGVFREHRRQRSEKWNQSPAGKEYYAAWRARHLEEKKRRDSEYAKERWLAVRQDVLTAYGHKCTCCGITQAPFLTLDHIHQDGKQHRKHFSGIQMYLDIKRQGYPKDKYRLLCMNCNFAIRWGAQCPHTVVPIEAV